MMWKDSYRLGVERIDQQHMELFRMTEDLVNAVKAGAGVEEYQKALGFLKDYVVYHFRDEEAYQACLLDTSPLPGGPLLLRQGAGELLTGPGPG